MLVAMPGEQERQERHAPALAPPDLIGGWRFWLLVPVIGVVSGLAGAAFSVILSGVEHFAFGFTTGTFVEAVTLASDARRFSTVVVAGVVVSIIWYSLRRWGPRVPSVSEAAAGAKMPVVWTAADTALQVANVGAGASIGREGGPRQFGAMASDRFSARLGLTTEQRFLLVAAGSGACLAAIYNAPLGGAAFALEAVIGFRVLKDIRVRAVVALVSAVVAAYLATWVAHIVVPNRPLYTVEVIDAEVSIYVFALVLGPVFGVAGYWYNRGFNWIGEHGPKGARILWVMPLCYLVLALISLGFPLVLGNGHALSQELYFGAVSVAAAFGLVVAKTVATAVTVGSGATGGKLTPSYATGAALAFGVGGLMALVWPVSPVAAAAIGSGAFMAAAMNVQVAAVVLAIEYTALTPGLWPALVLCVAGGVLGRIWMQRRFDTPGEEAAAREVVQ